MERTAATSGPLAGKTIALAETRESDRLAGILEQDGALTIRCPLVAILDAPDPAPIDLWLEDLAGGRFDDVIFLTGEGLRRLLARARVIGRHQPVLDGLARARKITRGPKPARALHEVGLASDLPAVVPTSAGVIESLSGQELSDRCMGLQLYGTDPNEPLVRFLVGKGALVKTVAPYVYAPASDEDKVAALITRMETGKVDAIAFTSASQVDRLWSVADTRQLAASLRAGLEKTKVAAIGPIVVEALTKRGVRIDIAPAEPFVMKRMTAAIVAALHGAS